MLSKTEEEADEVVREAFKRVHETKNTMGLKPTEVAAIELQYSRLGHIGATRAYDTLKNSVGHNVPSHVTLAQFRSVVQDDIIYKATQSTERTHRNLKYSKSQTATPTDTLPFHTLHIDIKTMDKLSRRKHKYVMLVTDETSGQKTPLFLATKTSEEAVTALDDYLNGLQDKIQLGILKVKRKRLFRADNGGEQKSNLFKAFLQKHQARIEFSDPYNSESNGRAERGFRTIGNTARAVRMTADMNFYDWDMCWESAAVLDYIHSTRANPERVSPYQIINGKQPNITFLRRLGSVAFVHNSKPSKKESEDIGRKGKLIGYTVSDRPKYIQMAPKKRQKMLHLLRSYDMEMITS